MVKTEKRRKTTPLPEQVDRAIAAAEDKKAVDLVLLDLPFLQISAATGHGVPELLEAMWRRLAGSRQSAA